MASIISRFRMAASAFGAAWGASGLPLTDRLSQYAYWGAWEAGTVFTSDPSAPQAAVWAERLRQQYRLYRYTRLVWNPVPDLNDFWGSVIYPGVLLRRDQLGGGAVSAIPLDEGINEALHRAIDQIWWWSGMAHLKYVIPWWAARDGDMLLKVVDDLANQKVYLRPVPACLVTHIEVSPAQDVLFVRTEERIPTANGAAYTYAEEIDRGWYRTFKDDKLFDFSGDLRLGAEYRNAWGFVPACWVPHQATGTAWGAPAVGSALPELLAINSQLSQLDDMVGRGAKPIPVFATDGDVTPISNNGKQGATGDLEPMDAGRESITAFKIPAGGTVTKLDPSGDVAAISAHLERRLAWFHRHFPELNMWESLRERNVSGIAAEILHGDTRNKVLNVRPGTDRQVEKATQMALTIAARRWHGSGLLGWGARAQTKQRRVFAPFTESSWDNGDLDFTIADRSLVPVAPLTAREQADLALVLQKLGGLPPAYLYDVAGVKQSVIDELVKLQTAADAAAGPAPPPVPEVAV